MVDASSKSVPEIVIEIGVPSFLLQSRSECPKTAPSGNHGELT